MSAALPPLELEVFAARRRALLAALGDSVAVLPSAPLLTRGRDTELRFRQDADLQYLTGFPEPGAVAVITPHGDPPGLVLFVRPRDPERESWTGLREGVEGALERYGAEAAYPMDEMEHRLPGLLEPAEEVVYALGKDDRLDRMMIALLSGFRRSRPRSGRGPLAIRDPDSVLAEMRLVKSAAEIERIRHAAQISEVAHLAAMRAAAPGVGEWELEAVIEGCFRAAGATGPAYPSIVGSGPNATVLHYTENARRSSAGELVLIDAGAEAGSYVADVTRTFPVSGRYTGPQRAAYEVVLAAEEAAIAAAVPGSRISDVHDAAVRELTRGMVELGLLQGEVDALIEAGAHRRYFLHQTSHWLGLDVHDVGPYRNEGESIRLAPGMVLTVEPGLYVPADDLDAPEPLRGIGIRIEDDLLITEDGHELLTRGVPVDPDQIEAVMRGER